jgi:hypothetical protein
MSIVNEFSQLNHLSDEKRNKLAKVVQDQLSALLPRIEESDEDETNCETNNRKQF